MSSSSKLRILEECGDESRSLIVKKLRINPWIKIIGDNLDLRVKRGQQTFQLQHQDLHLFTSIIVFSRVPDLLGEMSNKRPTLHAASVSPENVVILSGEWRELLFNSYKIILGRLLAKHLLEFKWMASVLPKHIPHRLSDVMAQKTSTHCLPLMFKNESRHADCIDIMAMYIEELKALYRLSYGDATRVEEVAGVPIGGDQLTRVRLSVAKQIRQLAGNPEDHFDHLDPIVCEQWHNKRDFLEKAYKKFLKSTTARDQCSLYYFKTILHRSDVNGNVKSNFSAHDSLFQDVGKEMLVCQSMEYFGMENKNSKPTKNAFDPNVSLKSHPEKIALCDQILTNMLNKHDYGRFDFFAQPPIEEEVEVLLQPVGRTTEGNILMRQINRVVPKDQVYNYCSQLCHWVLQYLSMDDTAKEGDVDRLVANSKYNIPFFFSHSKYSKYMVENLDFIIKTQYTLSPQESLRVRELAFLNGAGGKGKCYEADLKMEHTVRSRKELIRALGSNKTECAMVRATSASDAIDKLQESFDVEVTAAALKKPKYHSHVSTEVDCERIHRVLNDVKPFQKNPGRIVHGIHKLETDSPFEGIARPSMRTFIQNKIHRICDGTGVILQEGGDEYNSDNDEGVPDII